MLEGRFTSVSRNSSQKTIARGVQPLFPRIRTPRHQEFMPATLQLKQGYNSPNPGGNLWLVMWGPLGAGFSRNSVAGDVAYKKLSVPGPEDFSKDVCFRCFSCRRFVVSAAITGRMRGARFQRLSGSNPDRGLRRLNRVIPSPIVALHSRIA
jgi:hypothetical protein